MRNILLSCAAVWGLQRVVISKCAIIKATYQLLENILWMQLGVTTML